MKNKNNNNQTFSEKFFSKLFSFSLRDLIYFILIGYQAYNSYLIKTNLELKLHEMNLKLIEMSYSFKNFSENQILKMEHLSTNLSSKIPINVPVSQTPNLLHNNNSSVISNDLFWSKVVEYSFYGLVGIVICGVTYYVVGKIATNYENSGSGIYACFTVIDSSLKSIAKTSSSWGEYFLKSNSNIKSNITESNNLPNNIVEPTTNIVEPNINILGTATHENIISKINEIPDGIVILKPLNDGTGNIAFMIGSKSDILGSTLPKDNSGLKHFSDEEVDYLYDIAISNLPK